MKHKIYNSVDPKCMNYTLMPKNLFPIQTDITNQVFLKIDLLLSYIYLRRENNYYC